MHNNYAQNNNVFSGKINNYFINRYFSHNHVHKGLQEEFSRRKRVNTISNEWLINQKLLMNDGGSKV